MFIRVEPKDWNMHAVYLIFDQEAPHPEDEGVRRYLADHRLEAKTLTKTTLEDRECEVMYFGGCYLGRHLQAVANIQQYSMRQQMLSEEIPVMLREGPSSLVRERVAAMGAAPLWEEVSRLAEEYNRETSFEVDDDGQPHVALDAADVQDSFLKLAGVASAEPR